MTRCKQEVMRQRVCRQCGKKFQGGPRAWYCPECRAERKKEQQRRFQLKRQSGAGADRPLGSIDHCEICGKEYVVKSARQRFCPECAAAHLKQVDNAASLDYKKTHPEIIKKANIKFMSRHNGRFRKKVWENHIAELRNGLGLSQRQLAEKIGSSQPKVSTWELGNRKPNPKNYQKLCSALNVDAIGVSKKEKINKYRRKYYTEHKAIYAERRLLNKKYMKKYLKEYRLKHLEAQRSYQRVYQREYYHKHREKILEQIRVRARTKNNKGIQN